MQPNNPSPQTGHHGGGGHESRDIRLKGPLVFGASIIGGILLAFLVTRLLFGVFARREAREQEPVPEIERGVEATQPPEPRLQMNPRADLRAYLEEESRILHGYGWVDKKAGIARIPIDRAMDILLAKGFPAREGGSNGKMKP